ncbi:LLM class flavin-dependent oxidoreductase [Subtercola endophyticus]|uniref:LLM class flavin-dependent oxidoreductase n=1 Tax=Subtercola endophyticus TaxID=2895559 RepID=UPI001E2C40F3|nr:LLM class flavin-dependent oxidoreductase [Subtercola endophyticus]UFS59145.1 LLM class flavin-dependent oxidoreductase [Subtercola endophyticus]
MTMRFGYWSPLNGGWLRNIPDENTPATFEHIKAIALEAEASGFDVTLVPELNLNDQKGMPSPRLDAWTVAAGLAAVTQSIEIMAAVRPGFHLPAIAAKQAATIDEISGGRFSLNVVSAWWAEEARQYGGIFAEHDERYRRTEEFVAVLRGLWSETPFSFDGSFYQFDGTYAEPKPLHRPTIYAGGESEAGRDSISRFADAYVTHGGTVDEIREKIADLGRRRDLHGRPPLETVGMAAFAIVRDTEADARAELARITEVQPGPSFASFTEFVEKSELDLEITLKDYSVSNRGLRPGLVGTTEAVADTIVEFEKAGLGLLLLQFSPNLPELKRFAADVIPLVRQREEQLGL